MNARTTIQISPAMTSHPNPLDQIPVIHHKTGDEVEAEEEKGKGVEEKARAAAAAIQPAAVVATLEAIDHRVQGVAVPDPVEDVEENHPQANQMPEPVLST